MYERFGEDYEPALFTYDGPVMYFGKLMKENWHCETMAVTYAEATRNFSYRAKKLLNLAPTARVDLDTNKIKRR